MWKLPMTMTGQRASEFCLGVSRLLMSVFRSLSFAFGDITRLAMKHAPWLILAVLLAAPLALAVAYAREFLAVDAALDAGASYDYREGRADFTQSHPSP